MMKKQLLGLVAVLGLAVAASSSFATDATFTGTSGTHQATVTFQVSGNNLVVQLTNSSLADCLV
ncbi:MAG: PEP-CTERM sorting domain-containing protein, partial [Phycisphaerae bacterium]